MAELDIGAKTRRVLNFTVGLADPLVRLKLGPHGLDNAELTKGMGLVNDVTTARLDAESGIDPEALGAIDAWENHWFPIVEVVLRTNYPGVHAIVFRNLTQTQGVDVIVSARTMLDRIDLVAKPEADGGHPDGRAARALLVKRGFTEAVASEGRALLAQVGTVPENAALLPTVDPQKLAEAEAKMWNWYLEWSGIARTVIRDRASLRALGFLRRVRRPDGREEDVLVEDDDIEDAGNLVTVPTPTGPNVTGPNITGEDLVTGPTPEPTS